MSENRRFLAPQAQRGDGHGYLSRPNRELSKATHVSEDGFRDIAADSSEVVDRIAEARSLFDEPECISGGIVSYTESANKADTLRHARDVEIARQDRQRLESEQRIRAAHERAKRQHVNVSGELHVVQKMLDRAKAGGRREPVAAIRRLEKVEETLDGVPFARLKRQRKKAA
jgi:hypothetical protein